jgi:hypothetical protein
MPAPEWLQEFLRVTPGANLVPKAGYEQAAKQTQSSGWGQILHDALVGTAHDIGVYLFLGLVILIGLAAIFL